MTAYKEGRNKGFALEEALEKKTEKMKVKIDSLRVENQSLRSDLEAIYEEFGLIFRLSAFIRSFKKQPLNYIKSFIYSTPKQHIRKSVKQIKDSRRSNILPAEKEFKPYNLKILHPIESERLKVLHVIGNFYTGGSSQLVVDLVEHLGHRFEQTVLVRDLPPQPSYTGLEIHHYPQFSHHQAALSVLRTLQPDFLHVHYLGNHADSYSELDWKWYHKVFEAAQLYGCKVIENVNIPTDPYISDLVSSYIYVSDYVRDEFGHLCTRDITIYPGSDLRRFSRKNSTHAPSNCIGMVYRLEGDKLNEQAIDPFIKVVQRRPQTSVLIVGGGRFLSLYQAKTQQAGVDKAFTFTGYVSYDDLPQFFEQMSLFVAPVHTESFGQVTPFAMGMSIPVVGYEVGALPEIIGNRELLAPEEDSDKLADIIVNLLDDSQQRIQIGTMNRQRVQQLFSVETMINSYCQLYEELSEEIGGSSHG